MKTSITLTLRAFPVIVENTETQEVKKDIIVLTKEHLRAAQLVGQSSKELITRICANEGYRVVEIGKPAKRDVTFNLPLLCGLADAGRIFTGRSREHAARVPAGHPARRRPYGGNGQRDIQLPCKHLGQEPL